MSNIKQNDEYIGKLVYHPITKILGYVKCRGNALDERYYTIEWMNGRENVYGVHGVVMAILDLQDYMRESDGTSSQT